MNISISNIIKDTLENLTGEMVYFYYNNIKSKEGLFVDVLNITHIKNSVCIEGSLVAFYNMQGNSINLGKLELLTKNYSTEKADNCQLCFSKGEHLTKLSDGHLRGDKRFIITVDL